MSETQEPRFSLRAPKHDVTIVFTSGHVETVPDTSTLRLDQGWVFITDRMHAPGHRLSEAGGGYVSRTRSFPPGSIREIVTVREELD